MDGGGGDNEDMVGASVTGITRINGGFAFHYDESLANLGASRGYVGPAGRIVVRRANGTVGFPRYYYGRAFRN